MKMDTFGYLRQARRPGMYLALGIAMVAVYLSFTLTLNALVPVLAVLYLALVLARLIRNPGSGFRLGPNGIDWFTRRGRQSASLDELQSVAIGNSETGQTVCVLRLADGRTVPLSGVETLDPGTLMREFGRRGIRIMG